MNRVVRPTTIIHTLLLCSLFGAGAGAGVFPDAHEAPPAGWKGPVFKLRQDYPANPPAPETFPWKAIDVKKNPADYLRAVLRYCLEGNVEVDWQIEKNKKRGWYHAPWMHSTNAGREFVHGLTAERRSRPKELHPKQSGTFQNWAVGMYSTPGGYVLGQVWKNPNAPNPAVAAFPDGTVSVKLLFTQATVAQVPYLKGSFEWEANVTEPAGSATRKVQTLRLLQVDVAVRDTNVDSTTGWVFGTFVYDGDLAGTTAWDRLSPVGAMWGNDPKVAAPSPGPGVKLVETWINPKVGPPQHLGRAGRLNGPVDNPISSCLSCHSTAQHRPASPVVPPNGASPTEVMRWFRNIPAGSPFDSAQISLDYSLQLAVGIQRFEAAQPKPPGSLLSKKKKPIKTYPVTRDAD